MDLKTVQVDTQWSEAAATINSNNQAISVELTKLSKAVPKNKGYHKTLTALKTAYPTAVSGSIAYVGVSYPYSIYEWDTATSSWVATGSTGGDVSVDLSQMYTKEEVDKMVGLLTPIRVESEEAMQEMIDNGECVEGQLYYIPEL